jgi:Domain of unknown function (DUF4190)
VLAAPGGAADVSAPVNGRERQAVMSTLQSTEPGQPTTPQSARPRNGVGVAALVLGVASLVAALSFVLFPLALLGGLVAAVLGLVALTRGRTRGATNSGQAAAGVICGVLALALAIVLSVRVGTLVARNTNVFTNFDRCIAQAGDRSEVSACIARLSNDIRP